MTSRIGGPDQTLDEPTVRDFVARQLATLDLDGRSLCVIVPDRTRQCPLPLLLDAIADATTGRVASCTAVVALGTHGPLSDEALLALAGSDRIPVVNHEWWDDATFADVGSLDPAVVRQLSGGRLHEAVDVRINRLVIDSDVSLIVGPVLPHEVAGFSGGYKYFFPGLSGQDLIDVTHWLGALISSAEIIGTTGITPVRALIHAAAALVPGEHHALSLVVDDRSGDLEAMAFGDPVSSWAAAVEVAVESHVVHLSAPVERVLSLVPRRYDDLWTGAKGFYKVEPVVADGGEVVIYAPHITEISAMHPDLDRLGYHCRDFFLAQWERFRDCPRGELAHSTHLYGAGTYDPVDGERQRVRVTLATGIPRETVEAVNLHYLDPATVDVAAWRDDPAALVVPDAGEVLFRLRGHHDEGSATVDS
jgi:nickel-dependent lactate racemase